MSSVDDYSFFSAQSSSSKLKAEIVSEYFSMWSQTMIRNIRQYPQYGDDAIYYLDVFSGPGRYGADGPMSTPLLIMDQVRESSDLQMYLSANFNDANPNHIEQLRNNIDALAIPTMQNPPSYRVGEVDQELANILKSKHLPMTLMFVDPYGYKGLTLELLDAVLKGFGADVIFFLNYNRLRGAVHNSSVSKHVDALFGPVIAFLMKEQLQDENVEGKEQVFLKFLFEAFRKKGWPFFSAFKFFSDTKDDTSHFLIMVSKQVKAFDFMQDIMAKKSSSNFGDDFFSFAHNPKAEQLVIFGPSKRDELANQLLLSYAGKSTTRAKIWTEFAPGKPYIKRNYTSAIWTLYDRGQLKFDKTPRNRTQCPENTVLQIL